MSDRPIGFRLLHVCDVLSASAVRDHLHILGVTPQQQQLLPKLALELKAYEARQAGDPRDASRLAEVIAEVAAGISSPAHLDSLSTLLYIAAAFTEDETQLDQRLAWNRVFYESHWPAGLDSTEIPAQLQSALAATTDAYKIRIDRLDNLIYESDANWIAEGRKTVAPEHEVDSFGSIAGRRYLLQMARIIRFVATERQIAAIEEAARELIGFELRLP